MTRDETPRYTPGGLRYPTEAELSGGPDEGNWLRPTRDETPRDPLREMLADALRDVEQRRRNGAYPHLGQDNDIRRLAGDLAWFVEDYITAAIEAASSTQDAEGQQYRDLQTAYMAGTLNPTQDALDPEYEFAFGQPLCASCHHSHADGAWVDTDPDDGTCWNAGSLVCGCPKFITPAVQRYRMARFAARGQQ